MLGPEAAAAVNVVVGIGAVGVGMPICCCGGGPSDAVAFGASPSKWPSSSLSQTKILRRGSVGDAMTAKLRNKQETSFD